MNYIQQMIDMVNSWNINFYGKWSIMDMLRTAIIATAVVAVINYFFDKAET